jgi:hypothetical protein
MSITEKQNEHADSTHVIMLSSTKFMLGCVSGALAVLVAGRAVALPRWILAAEVFATIFGLFLFGSFRYQIHKNALTYGMLVIIIATFLVLRRRRGTRKSPPKAGGSGPNRIFYPFTVWMNWSMPTRCCSFWVLSTLSQ